jgi:hypothetical protein
MANSYRFDEENHEYFINNKKVPSVTQILKICGFSDELKEIDTDVLENARSRGRNIHDAIEILNTGGKLSQEAINELIKFGDMPYVDAAMEFKERFVDETITTEGKVWYNDDKYPYAGTYDDMFKIKDGVVCINDYKTSYAVKPSCALQLFAYYIAYLGGVIVDNVVLQVTHLKKNGEYDIYRASVPSLLSNGVWSLFYECLAYYYNPQDKEIKDRLENAKNDFLTKYKSLGKLMPKVFVIPKDTPIIDDPNIGGLLERCAELKKKIKTLKDELKAKEEWLIKYFYDYDQPMAVGNRTVELKEIWTNRFCPDDAIKKELKKRGYYKDSSYEKLVVKGP